MVENKPVVFVVLACLSMLFLFFRSVGAGTIPSVSCSAGQGLEFPSGMYCSGGLDQTSWDSDGTTAGSSISCNTAGHLCTGVLENGGGRVQKNIGMNWKQDDICNNVAFVAKNSTSSYDYDFNSIDLGNPSITGWQEGTNILIYEEDYYSDFSPLFSYYDHVHEIPTGQSIVDIITQFSISQTSPITQTLDNSFTWDLIFAYGITTVDCRSYVPTPTPTMTPTPLPTATPSPFEEYVDMPTGNTMIIEKRVTLGEIIVSVFLLFSIALTVLGFQIMFAKNMIGERE